MVSSIRLNGDKVESLTSLAKDSLPCESCALLLGETSTENLDEIIVSDVITVKNSDSSPVTFSIDPDDLINAYQVSEAEEPASCWNISFASSGAFSLVNRQKIYED